MHGIRYDEISYPEIMTFLSVAQTLNMSMTAQAMHISQPAVSKRIANLERKFHLILFTRADNGLQITPAGKVLYQELIVSVEHLKNGLAKAQETQAVPGRTLRLCCDGFFDLPLLYQIIREFEMVYPSVRVETNHSVDSNIEDCSELFSGNTDLAICPDSFGRNYEEYIQKLPISSFRFSILISRDNPLADQEIVTPADLLGIPLVLAHDHEQSPYLNAIRTLFAPYGFQPQIGYRSTRENLCFDVVSRKGITIASPEFWRKLNPRAADFFERNIRVYQIANTSYPVSLMWKKKDADDVIQGFVKCFAEVISRPENREILRLAYNG